MKLFKYKISNYLAVIGIILCLLAVILSLIYKETTILFVVAFAVLVSAGCVDIYKYWKEL